MLKGNRLLICFIVFGTFEVRKRAERKGRNLQTRKAITIPATKVPAFKACKELKEAIKYKNTSEFQIFIFSFLKCNKNAIDFNPYFVCSGTKSPNLNNNFIIDFVI